VVLQICRAYGAEEKSRRQELFGAGLKLAPGIVFRCETRWAANQAAQCLLDGKTRMIKLRKIIYAPLLGCFALWAIAFAWLHLSYSSNLPAIPDEKSGHIYRMVVNHGFVIYGSEREFRILRWVENSQPFAIVCFFIVLIVGLRSGDIKMAAGRKLNE
jgi:hypothetical protein